MRAHSNPPDRRARFDILVVEGASDSPLDFVEMLHRAGGLFEVWKVECVEEALRFLQQKRFDALIVDLDSSSIPGIDALLRMQVATMQLPVLAVSSEHSHDLAVHALRLGAQDCIQRSDATLSLMTRALVHAVERHRLLRAATEAREREHFLATHDPLTELPNRAHLEDFLSRRLDTARRRGGVIAAIFIDLDGFKAVNDTLGHAAGDELLRQTAERLTSRVRRGDLAARLSGDEFLVALIDPHGLPGALGAAHNLREVLTRPFQIDDGECWITPSMGIALFPEDADDADSLIRMADIAMYEAKRRGPNQICHPDRARGSERSDRFELVNGLRHALSRGELSVHFQPQIDLENGCATGVEALPRWRHRSEGWVSPGVFIPIAEQSGMVVALGDWVLRRACAAAQAWEGELTVAVNVSPVQLADPDFASRWNKIIRATGLAPERLEIEIAESSFGAPDGVSAENLARLRELGVRIVLDDFGTGTSSLSMLRALPVDCVKLDDTLVHGAVSDPRDQVILAGLVQMIQGLGMGLVAEGVETMDQLRQLGELGCRRAQGYLLAKPMPQADVAAVLRAEAWRCELDLLGL